MLVGLLSCLDRLWGFGGSIAFWCRTRHGGNGMKETVCAQERWGRNKAARRSRLFWIRVHVEADKISLIGDRQGQVLWGYINVVHPFFE